MAKKRAENTIAENRKARHDYHIEEKIEAGLVLQGWEVKSLRAGKAQLRDSYVKIVRGEAFVIGLLISPLVTASTHVETDSMRSRKLLLKMREISRLTGQIERGGYTAVLLALYWKTGKVKASLGIAKGRKEHDKRQVIKERDWNRDKERIMARRTTRGTN